EILQYRARLEDCEWPARRVLVDHGRDLVVRADAQEPGRELLAAQDVHVLEPVRQTALLEHDCNLEPVRRLEKMHDDHAAGVIGCGTAIGICTLCHGGRPRPGSVWTFAA